MWAETGALISSGWNRWIIIEFERWLLTRCTHFPKESRYMFMEPERGQVIIMIEGVEV
jgi:hypothetical protein